MSMMNVETRTILCRNCRTSCDIEDNFCARCGQRLRGTSTTPASGMLALPAPATSPAPTVAVRRTSPSMLLILALSATMLVIGLAALVVSFLHPTQQTNVTSSVQTQPTGIAWFYNAHKQNDAIAFRLRGLPRLAKGDVYVLWLINPRRPDQQMSLGPLTPDKNGSVSFASDRRPTFNPLRLDLRLIFTQLQLTIEHTSTRFLHPLGQPVLQGQLAPGSLDGITLAGP